MHCLALQLGSRFTGQLPALEGREVEFTVNYVAVLLRLCHLAHDTRQPGFRRPYFSSAGQARAADSGGTPWYVAGAWWRGSK